MAHDMLGTFKDWLGGQSDPSHRPYPFNSQAPYNRPVPVASSQVVVASYPYNLPRPGSNQFAATYDRNGGRPPASLQVVVPSGPYNGLPPPPPPPPVNSQVGAPSNSYNVPPPPPLASIQVTSSSDSNNDPPPANSQPYNGRMPAPPQNAM